MWRVLGTEHALHSSRDEKVKLLSRSLFPLFEEDEISVSVRRKLRHHERRRLGSLRGVRLLVHSFSHRCVFVPGVVHHGRAASQ